MMPGNVEGWGMPPHWPWRSNVVLINMRMGRRRWRESLSQLPSSKASMCQMPAPGKKRFAPTEKEARPCFFNYYYSFFFPLTYYVWIFMLAILAGTRFICLFPSVPGSPLLSNALPFRQGSDLQKLAMEMATAAGSTAKECPGLALRAQVASARCTVRKITTSM